MRKSFRFKVVLAFTFGIVLCVVFLIFGYKSMLRPIFIHDTQISMKSYSNLIIDAYLSGSETVGRTLNILDSSHDIQSVIVTGDCEVLLNSGEDIYPSSYKMTQLRQWLKIYEENKNKDNLFTGEITDETDNLARVVYIKQISEDSFICMSKVVRGIDQEVRVATYVIAGMGAIIIIIGALIWSVITKPFTRQMKKMSEVTNKMSQLNFEEKINYKGQDEIGLLAQSIDDMSDELKKSIDKLQGDVERRKRLIRDVSHELKTPVTTIRGYTENIQIVAGDNERVSKYCDIMLEECDVIQSLLSEMLYMSKIEDEGYECRMEVIDTKELQDKLLTRIKNEFDVEDISIDFEKTIICANETLALRAVFNYISNAVKYRYPDTKITVKGYCEEGGYVFSVSNYGAEIPEEDRELMWDVFYKTDKSRTRSVKGHGIGLTMVKQIAELHSGEVKIESENSINTFYIKFPLKLMRAELDMVF